MYLKIVYLILLGVIGTALIMTQWIPSLVLEIILGVLILVIVITMLYLVYKITREIYSKLCKAYPEKTNYFLTTVLSLILLGSVLFAMFINMVYFAFSGTCIEEYTFKNKNFYVYEVGFMDSITEVSVKMDYLPIRKTLTTVVKAGDGEIVQEGEVVYFVYDEEKSEIYDFRGSK